MILNLINDMNKALEAECYYAALAIALMLPDICSKAEYPEDNKTRKRYIKWFDNFIGKYERCNKNNEETPYLSGKIVYSLRNSFLHLGNPHVDNNIIDEFILVLEPKNEYEIYADVSQIDSRGKRIYEVNIRRLCLIIGNTAKGYYKENMNKFNFFNYSIRKIKGAESNKYEEIISILSSVK